MTHDLKILPEYFTAVCSGEKTFEVRKDGRRSGMKKSIKKAVLAALACAMLVPAVSLGVSRSKAETAQAITEEVIDVAILRQGATGNEVKEVQRRLKLWGYYSGSVDGVFGASTKKAVMAFQQKNGLTADGVVGASTYKALGMNSSYQALQGASSSSSANGYTMNKQR